MSKRITLAAVAALTLFLSAGLVVADETYTGEIVEKACFVDRGAHGDDHKGCAERCISRGGDMALLTADGDLYILRMDADNAAPWETLKELVAAQVTVSGPVVEEDNFKVMTVATSEAAGTN